LDFPGAQEPGWFGLRIGPPTFYEGGKDGCDLFNMLIRGLPALFMIRQIVFIDGRQPVVDLFYGSSDPVALKKIPGKSLESFFARNG